MTEYKEKRGQKIIHSQSASASVRNAGPVPVLGIAHNFERTFKEKI